MVFNPSTFILKLKVVLFYASAPKSNTDHVPGSTLGRDKGRTRVFDKEREVSSYPIEHQVSALASDLSMDCR